MRPFHDLLPRGPRIVKAKPYICDYPSCTEVATRIFINRDRPQQFMMCCGTHYVEKPWVFGSTVKDWEDAQTLAKVLGS